MHLDHEVSCDLTAKGSLVLLFRFSLHLHLSQMHRHHGVFWEILMSASVTTNYSEKGGRLRFLPSKYMNARKYNNTAIGQEMEQK